MAFNKPVKGERDWATKLNGTLDDLKERADGAQTTADSATTLAEGAQSTATAAQSAASAAQTTANSASATANAAETPAGAQAKANSALASANSYTDSEIAAEVTRADGKYETPAGAQAKVDTLSTSVNAALTDKLDVTVASNTYAPLLADGKGVVRKGDLVLNVKDYGATGDGVTDDRGAIQSALDAAAAAGGATVHLPRATYAIGTSLLVPAKTTLAGVGNGSVLRITGNAPAVQAVNNATDVTVRDLKVQGDGDLAKTLQRGVLATNPTGMRVLDVTIDGCARSISFNTGTRLLVQGCVVTNDKGDTSHGAIELAGVSRAAVTGCTVSTAAQHGIALTSASTYCQVTGNHVNAAGNVALYAADSVAQCAITGNTVQSPGWGVLIENGALHIAVTGNVIHSAANNGILISQGTGSAPSNFSITGNVVRSSGSHGIYVNNGNYCVIAGNRVAVFAGDGIRVGAGVSHSISNNLVTDASVNTGAAIRVYSGATQSTINGNTVRNCAGEGILADAARCTVTGNTVTDMDNATALTDSAGIHLTANASRTIVTGNVSVSSVAGTKQDFGVRIEAGCVNAVVTSNCFFPVGVSAVSDAGTGTVLANNVTA